MPTDDPFDEMNRQCSRLADSIRKNFEDGEGFYWTGWKSSVDQPNEAVGQWLDYREFRHTGIAWYCNLPNFKSGEYRRGGTLDIGTERVSAHEIPRARRLVARGLTHILAFSPIGSAK